MNFSFLYFSWIGSNCKRTKPRLKNWSEKFMKIRLDHPIDQILYQIDRSSTSSYLDVRSIGRHRFSNLKCEILSKRDHSSSTLTQTLPLGLKVINKHLPSIILTSIIVLSLRKSPERFLLSRESSFHSCVAAFIFWSPFSTF